MQQVDIIYENRVSREKGHTFRGLDDLGGSGVRQGLGFDGNVLGLQGEALGVRGFGLRVREGDLGVREEVLVAPGRGALGTGCRSWRPCRSSRWRCRSWG